MAIKYHCDCCDRASEMPFPQHPELGESMFCSYCMNGICKFAHLLHVQRWEKEYAAMYTNIPKYLPNIIMWAKMILEEMTPESEKVIGKSFCDLTRQLLTDLSTKGQTDASI